MDTAKIAQWWAAPVDTFLGAWAIEETETMITATETHLATIRARRIDATALEMMREGFTLTYEQADELGDEATDWIEQRLGLSVTETDLRVECSPAATICDHCGRPVAPEGVTLSEDEDVDTTGQDRPRCSDSACTC